MYGSLLEGFLISEWGLSIPDCRGTVTCPKGQLSPRAQYYPIGLGLARGRPRPMACLTVWGSKSGVWVGKCDLPRTSTRSTMFPCTAWHIVLIFVPGVAPGNKASDPSNAISISALPCPALI